MTGPSKDQVRITPELAGELLRRAADEIQRLQRENDGLTRDCNDKDITIQRLRTTLTGISTCSTCEVCRGAALLALGERSVAEINAAVDERLDRVERELARAPVTTGEGQ